MPTKRTSKPTLDEAIYKALIAMRLECDQRPKDVFKTTEKRLYAYPIIKAKIADDRDTMEWNLMGNVAESGGIVRFQKSGVRLSKEEIIEALVQDLRAKIAANEHEIETLDKALNFIAADPYVNVIHSLYFEGKSVTEAGEAAHCDRSTVFRQKARLVQRLATFLYGVEAL